MEGRGRELEGGAAMTLQHETCRTQAGVTAWFPPRDYLSEEGEKN